ncbi:hydrogenase nickel incorporation protein HypB [Lachnospira pectinoschiza]|uniref:Hydrogenase nickel incorporation protein HypB n=1 Tax=Lachnospira pectinoschiza TaxID=28052 RepID=A0A1G9WSU2_9FIRM|nr:hydrogenase nickel incorporation protein HypB [Lachnospira pectinoschiza]SDM87674.1 Hydrogenase nickel incorporation protein HypB [Lachnospira pectinoschiza]
MKVVELHKSVTESNDRDANDLRKELKERKVCLVNLMSSPGAGKTTLLAKTVTDLKDQLKIGVIEADIASDVDAIKISNQGAKSIQVHTDGMCHMDAGMTKRGVDELGVDELDLVFLENVGNLICPAEFDTGAHKNVMILSVPEGDDKPLKYPLMFERADALLLTKMDTIKFFNFDLEKCIDQVKKLNPNINIFPVSAKTGEGMDKWEAYLKSTIF